MSKRPSAGRKETLKVRINEIERFAFEEAATVFGLTISAWVRMVLRERVSARITELSKSK